MKNKKDILSVLDKFKKTATSVVESYSNQHKHDLETFLKKNVTEAIPKNMNDFGFVSDIICDMARAEIMGITLSENKTKEHYALVEANIERLMEDVEIQIPEEFKKFAEYGLPAMIALYKFQYDANEMVEGWKEEGGDVDEYFEKNSRCKCGHCDPYDEAGNLISELLIEMAHATLEERAATNEETERWLKMIAKVSEILDRKRLIGNIGLN